jgi:predicted lipid-binding transport protein (Tim44 family)
MAFGTLGPAFEAAKDTVTAPSFMDYLAAGLQGAGQAQKTQQPSYQSMVPPQSMTMQPQMQQAGRRNVMPTVAADNLLAAAAARQLAAAPKEGEGEAGGGLMGGLLGGLGSVAGLALGGGPTGAALGGKLGSALGDMVG